MFKNNYDNGGVNLKIWDANTKPSLPVVPDISVDFMGFAQSSAAGGFVIYPNKANPNMMKSVYSK